MLIGIDMLGVQSPESGDREAGRYGRQLVEGLLARDPVNRYVLYTHEGMPVDRVPTGRNALRVSLAPVFSTGPSRLRSTIQRLLDHNPDGLDWLLLLDPFDPNYGGLPPESPLNRLKVASIVHDMAPAIADDRTLAPLRRHDAVLAVAESIALECRKRLGQAAARVSTIGVACGESFAANGAFEPMTQVSGNELGRLGIDGPFLFASLVGGPSRGNLTGILEGYHRLPIEHRQRHRLVIAGAVDYPQSIRSYLYDRGCDDGLVLLGEVSERSLKTLYGRCSAFLSPSFDEGSGQSLVEAMKCGAVVMAGRVGAQPEIVGDAGLLVDPLDPSEIAEALANLLADANLDRDLRKRAKVRSTRFSWGPVVDSVVLALKDDGVKPSTRRLRFDRGHVARPRIAVFPSVNDLGLARVDLDAQIPGEWRQSYNVDLYLKPGASRLADGLPPEFGGFDDRLFDRNDSLLGYHAVVYRFETVADLEAKLDFIARRPGLVFLLDENFLDQVEPHVFDSASKARLCDSRSDGAIALLHDLFATGSRVVVESRYHLDRIKVTLPDYADQVVEIPPIGPGSPVPDGLRARVRTQLDIMPDTLVIGQFRGRGSESNPGLLTARDLKAIAKLVPELVLLSIDAGGLPHQASTIELDDRSTHPGLTSPINLPEMVAALDLAIHLGEPGAMTLVDLLKAGVPTVAIGSDFPDSAVRHVKATDKKTRVVQAVRELVLDPVTRSSLGRSALAFVRGAVDSARSSGLLIEHVEHCASDLPRNSGRRLRRRLEPSRGLPFTPHQPRQASATDEADTRSR